MKDFIKKYIDIFNDMDFQSDEKIETIIDLVDVLKEKNTSDIFSHIVKPLLIEYRETEDNTTIADIEDLFSQLLELI